MCSSNDYRGIWEVDSHTESQSPVHKIRQPMTRYKGQIWLNSRSQNKQYWWYLLPLFNVLEAHLEHLWVVCILLGMLPRLPYSSLTMSQSPLGSLLIVEPLAFVHPVKYRQIDADVPQSTFWTQFYPKFSPTGWGIGFVVCALLFITNSWFRNLSNWHHQMEE